MMVLRASSSEVFFSMFILFPSSISESSVDKPKIAIVLDITFVPKEDATK